MGKVIYREPIEAIFVDEASKDETFDCRSDLNIICDRENKRDGESSDLDIQMEVLISLGIQ